jgi:hypothetical protein
LRICRIRLLIQGSKYSSIIVERYEQYLQANREQVLKEAPRRKKDLRVFEAVFQFHLYLYLVSFFRSYEVQVHRNFQPVMGQLIS